MEKITKCSYEGCPGSPKSICSCKQSLKFCEEHLSSHLKQQSSHTFRPITLPKPKTAFFLLAQEMKTLSSTMSKVILSGKNMFQEICRKLCEITDEINTRQEKLLEIASNFTESEDFPIESFKDLGNLGLQFKSSEDFGKLVDDHFSKDSSSADFSLFTEDIKNIREFLGKSNQLIEDVRTKTQKDKKRRKKIKKKVNEVQEQVKIVEQGIEKKIQGITEQGIKKFILDDRILEIEQRIDIQNKKIDEINKIVEKFYQGFGEESRISQDQYERFKELRKVAEKEDMDRVHTLVVDFQQQVDEVRKVVNQKFKNLEELIEKRNDDTAQISLNKYNAITRYLNEFLENYEQQMQVIIRNYDEKFQIIEQYFRKNVREGIDEFEKFKSKKKQDGDKSQKDRQASKEDEKKQKNIETEWKITSYFY